MFQVIPIESDNYTHVLLGEPSISDNPVEGSIEKWATIVFFLLKHPEAVVDDHGWTTCPLCNLYYHQDNPCNGCPISNMGHPLCEDTPYTDYAIDPSLANARAELKFLHEARDENTE